MIVFVAWIQWASQADRLIPKQQRRKELLRTWVVRWGIFSFGHSANIRFLSAWLLSLEGSDGPCWQVDSRANSVHRMWFNMLNDSWCCVSLPGKGISGGENELYWLWQHLRWLWKVTLELASQVSQSHFSWTGFILPVEMSQGVGWYQTGNLCFCLVMHNLHCSLGKQPWKTKDCNVGFLSQDRLMLNSC